jgi:hypothetical protein
VCWLHFERANGASWTVGGLLPNEIAAVSRNIDPPHYWLDEHDEVVARPVVEIYPFFDSFIRGSF